MGQPINHSTHSGFSFPPPRIAERSSLEMVPSVASLSIISALPLPPHKLRVRGVGKFGCRLSAVGFRLSLGHFSSSLSMVFFVPADGFFLTQRSRLTPLFVSKFSSPFVQALSIPSDAVGVGT